MNLFLFGTLRDDALREIVIGRAVGGRAARLAGHGVRRAVEGDHPVIGAGEGAEGLLVEGLGTEEASRLDYYEGAFGCRRHPVRVTTQAGEIAAQVYAAEPESASDAAWDLSEWQSEWAPLVRKTAEQAMALYGQGDSATLARRLPMMRVRASSALRAAECPAPRHIRADLTRDDVTVETARRPYVNFFALDEYDLEHPHFDGGRSGTLNRAGLVSGDAVTVLPYDPARDRVLVIEQFRFGPFSRGDLRPWCLEPVAGRVDPGEAPETAARREAEEEARLDVGALWTVASYYPSPGVLTEYLWSYVGVCDLPDGAETLAGKADEGEDIRTHVLSFDRLMELITAGEVDTAPLLLTAFWLARARAEGLPAA